MEMTKQEFDSLRLHVRKMCGIELGDDKDYLVRQRFEPLLRANGYTSFTELINRIDDEMSGILREEIIASITTNETFFFRDDHPFEMFRQFIMPVLALLADERKNRPDARKGSKVSILSAGASTGQEAYTLSMIINDRYPFTLMDTVSSDDFTIIGGDISHRVLSKAISGEYTDAEIGRGLDEQYRSRYMTKSNGVWIVKDRVRRIVSFRRVNFAESFMFLGGFDCIFCRNMLIYFDLPTKMDIIEQFYQMLPSGGFLILGATENLYSLNDKFESKHVNSSIVYVKK
jgi:chemotaxis protein methyltransferase CheR